MRSSGGHAGLAGSVLAAALTLGATGSADDGEVLAVLSSDAPYYQEALAGLKQELGRAIPAILATERSREVAPRVVVSFGSRAARRRWPEDVALVTCLAPEFRPGVHERGRCVQVEMLPPAPVILDRLLLLQPGLGRLQVFWISEAAGREVADLRQAGMTRSLTVDVARLGDAGDLPDALRALAAKPDAVWVPPDARLITPESFAVLRNYAWANGVPLYMPSAGLADQGAVAALYATFAEQGRAAGRAVRSILANEAVPASVRPDRLEVAVNRSAAARTGLMLSSAALASATRVVP